VAASVSQAHAELKQSEWDSGFKWASVSPSIEAVMADDCTVYVCASWHTAPDIWSWMATRSSHHSYCVWHKQNPMPSLMKRHWTWASELICYATYGKHTFNFPAEGHASNVWTIIKQSDGTHPTQKPVAVPAQAISHSSNAGDIVADPFLGSGTTMLAAEQLNRKCCGMEISPAYCAVILQRMTDAGCTCTLE
jgi:DNA modification methylase